MTQIAGSDLLIAVEPEDVTAGTAGFVVIAALVVGTVFLLRSLNKQLKKVDFEEETDETAEDGTGEEGTGGSAAGEDPDGADRPSDGAPVSDEPEEGPRSPQG
jgi:hypothetical protein